TIARLLSDKEDFERILAADSAEEMYAGLQQVSTQFHESQEKSYKQVRTTPSPADLKDGHATIILLARLQLNQEMHAAARSGKKEIKQRMEGIRALVQPRILKHFDRVMTSRPPALVPVEGDTCQGCFIRLPSQFVQQVRLDTEHLHTCSNCSRYIYVV
ncbi:MAG: C4-type zinc ribbon domain-containing protein, partial [Candidatus Hydrogenedentales bacterium]